MEYNWVAIFGFGVFLICWGFLIYKRGLRGIRYGLETLLLVAGVLATSGIFQFVGGLTGKLVFVALVWIAVAVIWYRQVQLKRTVSRASSAETR